MHIMAYKKGEDNGFISIVNTKYALHHVFANVRRFPGRKRIIMQQKKVKVSTSLLFCSCNLRKYHSYYLVTFFTHLVLPLFEISNHYPNSSKYDVSLTTSSSNLSQTKDNAQRSTKVVVAYK